MRVCACLRVRVHVCVCARALYICAARARPRLCVNLGVCARACASVCVMQRACVQACMQGAQARMFVSVRARARALLCACLSLWVAGGVRWGVWHGSTLRLRLPVGQTRFEHELCAAERIEPSCIGNSLTRCACVSVCISVRARAHV